MMHDLVLDPEWGEGISYQRHYSDSWRNLNIGYLKVLYLVTFSSFNNLNINFNKI